MRFSSSRQESPASSRIRVRLLATTVLLPLEPDASTVIRIMDYRITPMRVEELGLIVPSELPPFTRDSENLTAARLDE
jgi:hypothetical protein